jgi:lysophospholipase L1-like esterase
LLVRLGTCPLAGLLAGALALVALERSFHASVEMDVESVEARSVSFVEFPRSNPGLHAQHALAASRPATISSEMHTRVKAMGLKLGGEPGTVRIREVRVRRMLTWLSWQGAELGQWSLKSGVAGTGCDSSGLSIELPGGEAVVLGIDVSSEALEQGKNRERMILGGLAGLLGAALGSRPARRAWRAATRNQRWLAGYYALFLASAIVLLPWGLRLARAPGGYQDPTGDYDLSLLDPLGRRISNSNGRLGFVLDPFTVVRNYPRQQNASLSIDAHGFRGGIPDTGKPLAFLLGGSTAFGYGLARDEDAISARLNVHLDRWSFVNAGVSGFVSGQELALIVSHLDGWKPPLYIVLDGWNDLMEAVLFARDAYMRSLPIFGATGGFFVMAQDLHEHALRKGSDSLPPWPFPPLTRPRTLEERFEEALERYVSNVERMHAWSSARDAGFLVALQPELTAKRVLSEQEANSPRVPENISESYHRFAARACERLAVLGIPHVNLLERSEIADCTEQLFQDQVHLTARGCDVVAEVLADEIRALLTPLADNRSSK